MPRRLSFSHNYLNRLGQYEVKSERRLRGCRGNSRSLILRFARFTPTLHKIFPRRVTGLDVRYPAFDACNRPKYETQQPEAQFESACRS